MDEQTVVYPFSGMWLDHKKKTKNKKQVLIHITACINLQNIMLCERRQSQRTPCMVLFTNAFQKKFKPTETERRTALANTTHGDRE